MLEYRFVFALVFILRVQNGPKLKTKISIEITLLQMACFCLQLVQVLYSCWRTSPEVLIEIGLVLIIHGNENPFQHVLVCIFIIYPHFQREFDFKVFL